MKYLLLGMAAACALSLGPASADHLAQPTGPVILTISGDITHTNGDGVARFDLEMLRAIGETSIETTTIWTSGTIVFDGVELEDLLEHVGAQGDSLSATAINDYAVSIPVSDAIDGGPILAFEMDDKVMSRRDKGPLWVIYPFSSSSSYRTEVIYARSIWQLDRMIVGD